MKPARCRTALILLFFGAVALPSVERGVQAEVNYFPIPSVSSTKNDGSSAGLILPTLITDQAGDLKYIVAPLFVVNTFVGAQGALNLFAGFDTRTGKVYATTAERKRQVEFIAFLEHVDREIAPAITTMHVVLDNIRVHKGKQVQA